MKWWTVAVNEIRTTFSRRWFVAVTFGIPVVFMLVFLAIRLLSGGQEAASPPPKPQSNPGLSHEGYVDLSGIIQKLPPDLPDGILIAIPDETVAANAMRSGEIEGYYVVSADYLSTGELAYIRREYNPLGEGGQQHLIRWALLYNLLGGDMQLARNVLNPAIVNRIDLAQLAAPDQGISAECLTPGYACQDNAFLRYLPLIFLLIFFMAVMVASSQLLHQLAVEKENRIIEVLTLSVSPRQLMAGKIVGLGLIGLMQVSVWMGTTYILTITGASTFNLPEGFSIPTWYIGWGLGYFLFGYALYASLMAGAGALIPDTKSYSSVAMLIASPMYAGYMLTFVLGNQPNGLLATALSLFPLTSPVTMMWRLVQTGVPAWQLYTSICLLAITALLALRSVARIFRAQELLSGQPFRFGTYVKSLLSG